MKTKIACCQMPLVADKKINLLTAERMIRNAAKAGAELIVLPEMYLCPYAGSDFIESAEPANGPSNTKMSALAKELKITLFAGSIPESEEDRIYNTCFVFGSDGACIGRHRKMHLFDINVKNGITFKESNILTPGDKVTLIDTPFGLVGVAICFDLRFPELFRIMVEQGAKLIVVPAAFNMTTGPLHWALNLKSRAIDNQCYIAACSSARDITAKYCAWGHSCIVDPWGNVLAGLEEKSGTITETVDTEIVDSVRAQLPILSARRTELYEVIFHS